MAPLRIAYDQPYMVPHLPDVIFQCIYCCFDLFYSSFSDCNFGQKLFIISLCSTVMSLCYIIIIILSAYNVTNKAEQCPNNNNISLTFCYLIVMFPKYLLIVISDAITYHVM